MHRLTSSFVLGYHGCSTTVAEQLFSGREVFKASDNDYDWLGPGIYFWLANPRRALKFAEEKRKREKARWKPAVVGAAIDPGLCLDLSTESGVIELRAAYELLKATFATAGRELPSNSGGLDMMLRRLDCAVVQQLHAIRREADAPPVDTVRGIFIEGEPIYPGAGLRDKTHIQICVCNPQAIRGVFRVPPTDMEIP